MQFLDGQPVYSASDLNNYLECAYLTAVELQAALAGLPRPPRRTGTAAIVAQLGEAHEMQYLHRLRAEGLSVTELPSKCAPLIPAMSAAEDATVSAMGAAAPVIYQGAFFDGSFMGRTDFLRRVARPSARWASHSYEVLDAKLALHPKPYFLLQLCHYSEHVERIQGTLPEFMYVILGNGNEQRYRVADYFAYYKYLKRAFLRDVATPDLQAYPIPNDHCDVCSWEQDCIKKRRDDDYLRLVAWMRNDQVERFTVAGITKVAQLAVAADDQRPKRMARKTFERLREQAALQVRQRETEQYHHKILTHPPWAGFGLLPAPALGDVFFDMEGDPLFEIGIGLEYLFGCWLPGDTVPFKAFWGLTRAREKRAFEGFIDFIISRLKQFPAMHVYHYAPYETVALKKLAQRHCTRQAEVDSLLTAELFIDLYAVVRQTLMISQESYSIKKLEAFYPFKRSVDLRKGDDSIAMFEWWRAKRSTALLKEIRDYNQDDCRSTLELRNWLLQLRGEYEQREGLTLSFREPKSPDALCHEPAEKECPKCQKRLQKERDAKRASETEHALLAGLPSMPETMHDFEQWPEADRERFLLAQLLAYHRRERKPVFWEYFHRCNNIDELVEFDKDCLGGLELDTSIPPYKANPGDRNLVYTYRYPDQEYDLTKGDLYDPVSRELLGEEIEIDEENNRIALKLSKKVKGNPSGITAVVPLSYIEPFEQMPSLQRIGAAYLDGTLTNYSALLDLLRANAPRFFDRAPGATVQPERVDEDALYALISTLDSSVLFVQGPPGTGKSTKSAAVIARLLAAGKSVGVMSTTHDAIHALNRKVERAVAGRDESFRGAHKGSSSNEGSEYVSDHGFITSLEKSSDVDNGDFQFVSGNAWYFARSEVVGRLDYIFIDEAGQISLADALSVAQCARNIVLIGDPLQLAQVSKGIHPVGAGRSVLAHLLGDHQTIPPDRGVFLDLTYRLHPTICAFVSDAIYEGRLKASSDPDGNAGLHRIGSGPVFGNGLRYVPIRHSGNSRDSLEEADQVVNLVSQLVGAECVDDKGNLRPATIDDVIIVAPYNAQRRLIKARLKERGFGDVPVGTVDKFQGQEAFAVIYSMATSSEKDAPRGLSFLMDRNRFNVAISRCKALAVVVSSESLVESRCNNISDMGLLSLLCSYADSASVIAMPSANGHSRPPAGPALNST